MIIVDTVLYIVLISKSGLETLSPKLPVEMKKWKPQIITNPSFSHSVSHQLKLLILHYPVVFAEANQGGPFCISSLGIGAAFNCVSVVSLWPLDEPPLVAEVSTRAPRFGRRP